MLLQCRFPHSVVLQLFFFPFFEIDCASTRKWKKRKPMCLLKQRFCLETDPVSLFSLSVRLSGWHSQSVCVCVCVFTAASHSVPAHVSVNEEPRGHKAPSTSRPTPVPPHQLPLHVFFFCFFFP